MIEYTPTTPETAEAFDYGYGKGVEEALGELYEVFGTDLEATSLWKEYIEKGEN
jgi:hypothetical protein